MDANDLQKLEIAVRQATNELERRISAIENKMLTDDAVEAERRENERKENARRDQRIDAQETIVSRVVWLAVTAIVGGFMAFVISGGMSVAPL